MGCHTLFLRPVTKEEFELFKSHAIETAWELNGDTDINRECGAVDIREYLKVKESVENWTDYWWKRGYGTWIKRGEIEYQEYVNVINGTLYLDLAESVTPIFTDIKRYYDIFRVYTYPKKVIHNRHELRRWMRKKYFELETWQLEKISEFFQENPRGVIRFG